MQVQVQVQAQAQAQAQAQTVGALHGVLVLYNNGFAAGPSAAILVAVILALRPADAGGDTSR